MKIVAMIIYRKEEKLESIQRKKEEEVEILIKPMIMLVSKRDPNLTSIIQLIENHRFSIKTNKD